jgi:hypothetical protein
MNAQEFLDEIEPRIIKSGSRGEVPHTAFLYRDGEVEVYVLAEPGGGVSLEMMARTVAQQHQYEAGVIATEAWTPNPEVAKTPYWDKIRKRQMFIRDLPANLRSEVIVLIAEDTHGNHETRYYTIKTISKKNRVVARLDDPGMVGSSSRFDGWLIHQPATRHAHLQDMAAVMDYPPRDFKPEE